MNIIKSAAVCALLGTSILSSPALAAVTLISPVPAADPAGLTAGNLAIAQAQCDAAAALLDTDGSSPDSDLYTAEVVESGATLANGPTEIGGEGDRDIDEATRVGAGTFTPAHTEIEGDPYRNGGSVNMFGNAIAVGGRYSNSAYDFSAQFTTTYTHAYTCNIYVATYNPAVPIPRAGYWIVHPDFHGNEEAVTNNCNAFNTSLPTGPQNGHPTDQANCRFTETQAAGEEPAYHDDPVLFATGVPGGSFNQDQTDTLNAHEDFGSGFDTEETLNIGKVVVCISPTTSTQTKKGAPGTWVAKNGYTGGKCTTEWYNGGAKDGVSNLNTGSHNWVTVPIS